MNVPLADVHFRVELEVRFEARFLQNENREERQRHRNNFDHFIASFFLLKFFSNMKYLFVFIKDELNFFSLKVTNFNIYFY